MSKSKTRKYRKLEGRDTAYLYTRPPSKIIHVRRRKVGKKQLLESLKTESIPEARMKRDEVMARWLGEKLNRRVRKTIEFVYNEMVEIKTGSVKSGTLSQYEYVWKRMKPDFAHLFIDDFKSTDWDSWVSKQRLKDPELRMFNFFKLMSNILTHAFNAEYIARKPKIKNDKDPEETRAEIYTDEEVETLLRNAEGDLLLKIRIISTVGIRPKELNQLRKDRIDRKAKMIKFKGPDTKTGKPRDVPLPDDLFEAIVAHADSHKGSYLFLNHEHPSQPVARDDHDKEFQALKQALGIEKRFYDLRHTAATRMLRAQMNPVIIAKIMGHSLKMFFSIYAKPTDKDFHDEMEKLNQL